MARPPDAPAARPIEDVVLVLSVIPLILGYLLASRVVGEREGHLRFPLAYALGLSCFLFGVNAFFHVFPLRGAVWATLGLMALASVALWSLRARQAVWPRLGRLDRAVLVALTLTAFFRALFWQMKHSDDDFFPHAALMALYLRDIFPPRVPFYPDQFILGQYGRDLAISGFSVLWGERFFAVQYVVTALNHAMTVLLVYFASRRFLRSPRAALLAVVLVFLGLNPYLHRSLLDVFSNNTTFVHLFLFLNAYLFLSALRRPRLGATILSALCLATYSIVYTTHHGALLVAFPLLTLAVAIRSRRWRALRLVTAAAILSSSLAVSLVHGGTLSDVGHRYLFSVKPPAGSTPETALVSQQVNLRFPKGRLGFTAFDGTPYSLFSLRVLQLAGYPLVLLPATTLLLFLRRRYWALLLAVVGMVAVLIPATVDFGAYENDTYRFLFLAGLGSAMALGVVVGMGLDRLATGGSVPNWTRVAMMGLLLFTCSGSVVEAAWGFADVARRPQAYPWSAKEWACNTAHWQVCDPVDVSTAAALRRLIRPRESILTNIYDETDREFIAHTVISAFARAFVIGHGIKVSANPAATVGREFREPAGFRAIAFWATGATELLDDLQADWLLVDPSRLSLRARESLATDPRLRLVLREENATGGGVREVYRVERGPLTRADALPMDLILVSADLPSKLRSARFVPLPFVVSTRDPAFAGRLRVGALVRTGGILVNAGDSVRHVVQLRRAGPGRWMGTLFFVSPFEPGEYSVEISAGPMDTPLRGPSGTPTVLRLKVI